MPINYKDYHPKWSLIRRLILKRSSNCCERCGIENYSQLYALQLVQEPLPSLFDDTVECVIQKVPKTVVILTIAHLDHNRNNNRFHNLRALCQKCHLLHDLGQRVFSFKYGKETQYQNGKLF